MIASDLPWRTFRTQAIYCCAQLLDVKLQESLGGNAKTSLVVAIADAAEHLDETLQSMQFGQRAMRVQTKAKINESASKDLLNADLLKRLGSNDIVSCGVDASLLAKEEELRAIQEALAVGIFSSIGWAYTSNAHHSISQMLRLTNLTAAQICSCAKTASYLRFFHCCAYIPYICHRGWFGIKMPINGNQDCCLLASTQIYHSFVLRVKRREQPRQLRIWRLQGYRIWNRRRRSSA